MNNLLVLILIALVVILFELWMIINRLGSLMSPIGDIQDRISDIQDNIGGIRSSLSGVEVDISEIAGNSLSIENSISHAIRGWLDEYATFREDKVPHKTTSILDKIHTDLLQIAGALAHK